MTRYTHPTDDQPADLSPPLVTAREAAAVDGDHAAPALAIDGRFLVTPLDYAVRTPNHRPRDYDASLPGDLAAAIEKLADGKLGPGDRGMVTGGASPAQQRSNEGDYLGPAAARKESVRAVLALLVDETAAHVIETTTALAPEPWTRAGTRAPGRRQPGDPVTKPVVALSTTGERVIAPSRRGRPRELASKWPPSAAARWWQDTAVPAAEALPGVVTTTGDNPRRSRTRLRFTDGYERQVRRGVLVAAAQNAALADALGVTPDDADARDPADLSPAAAALLGVTGEQEGAQERDDSTDDHTTAEREA
jgi:hypothetical protein